MISSKRDIARARLQSQHLVGRPLASPVDVVRWFAAVQSQDYPAAKWAVAQRTGSATEFEMDQLYDEGAILRTHVMRPTWHFVLPDDIRWLADLTGPRVHAGIAGRHRQLGLDAETISRGLGTFERSLRDRDLTRRELGDELQRAGISPEGQRLPHLLMAAELMLVIASGPRRGREFTYSLLDVRAPNARRLSREEALHELTLRYFRSHGPAQLSDFTWWSGLTLRDVRAGIASAGKQLERATLDGNEYWFDGDAIAAAEPGSTAHLLPNFDEYTVAYRDRAAALHDVVTFEPDLFSFGSILSNIVTVDGGVRGVWRRVDVRGDYTVELRLLSPLSSAEAELVANAARRYGQFLGKPVEVVAAR